MIKDRKIPTREGGNRFLLQIQSLWETGFVLRDSFDVFVKGSSVIFLVDYLVNLDIYGIMATGGSGRERNLVYDPQKGIASIMISVKKIPLDDKDIQVMTTRAWGKQQGFINVGSRRNPSRVLSRHYHPN